MRVQTLLGILLALVAVVLVAFLTQQNTALLQEPFRVSGSATVPLYAVFIGVFLLGFLPVVSILVVRTLKQDLAQRRQRRFERESRSLRGTFRRAVDLQSDGQWQRAAEEFEAVLADQPEDFGTLLRLGETLRLRGRADEAVEVHRRASVLYPQSVAVLYELAEDYSARGETEVAREIHERVLRDFPGLGLQILRRRRDAALAKGDWPSALRFQEAIESASGQDDLLRSDPRERAVRQGLAFQRGVARLESERMDEALTIFQAILDDDPEFVPAQVMAGEAISLTGDSAAAVETWTTGWLTTGSPTLLQRIEDHYIEREAPMEAIETLRRIIAEAENDLLPRFFLGKLYSRLEMHDEALKILGSIRDRVHDSPVLLGLIGRLHERRGEGHEAGEAFRAGLELARPPTDSALCDRCGTEFEHWSPYCERCGAWNSVELQLGLEAEGGDESDLRERPVWPVHGES